MRTNRATARRASHGRGARAAGGFTLVEGAIVLIIIALIAGILLVALRGARSGALVSVEQQTLRALKTGVDQFQRDYGFYPPLIDDANPVLSISGTEQRYRLLGESGPERTQIARLSAYLRDPNRPHQSIYSLAGFLVGVGDKALDGVDGLGFTQPQADGTFSRRGAKIDPLFEIGRDRARLGRGDYSGMAPITATNTADPRWQQGVILDRWNSPIVYLRWEPTLFGTNDNPQRVGEVNTYNVPPLVLQAYDKSGAVGPDLSSEKGAGLRSARFAILSAGPDRLLGTADDLVEVGP